MSSNKKYYDLLKKAQDEKLSINKNTLLKTKKLYQKAINDLIKKINNTETFNQAFIKDQIKYFRKRIKEIDLKVEYMIEKGITDTSEIMTGVNGDFFSYINEKYNLNLDQDLIDSLYSTNEKVIKKIIEGGLYKDKLSLSERVWNYSEKNINDVQDILLKGMIEKKPLKEICDELSAYTGGKNSKVSSIKRTYGNMSANALRLVRTSLNHAFLETMKDECRYNPFVEGYKWELSSQHSIRMHGRSDICDEYANSDEFGLGEGVYPKNITRIPHPNCLCIITAYIPKNLDDIGAEIRRWIDGESNKGIDKWVKEVYEN